MALKKWASAGGVNYSAESTIFGRFCTQLANGQPLYVFTERLPCEHCLTWLDDFAGAAATTIVAYCVAGLGPKAKDDDPQFKHYLKTVFP